MDAKQLVEMAQRVAERAERDGPPEFCAVVSQWPGERTVFASPGNQHELAGVGLDMVIRWVRAAGAVLAQRRATPSGPAASPGKTE